MKCVCINHLCDTVHVHGTFMCVMLNLNIQVYVKLSDTDKQPANCHNYCYIEKEWNSVSWLLSNVEYRKAELMFIARVSRHDD